MKRVCLLLALVSSGALLAQPAAPPATPTPSRGFLEVAAERASKASPHPNVVVLNAAKGLDTPFERTNKLEKAWPGRILLGVFTQEMTVIVSIPDDVKDRFSDEEKRRIGYEVDRAMTRGTLVRTLARVTGEMGAIASGHPPARWVEWKPSFFKQATDSVSELFRKGDFTGGLRHGIQTVGRALVAPC